MEPSPTPFSILRLVVLSVRWKTLGILCCSLFCDGPTGHPRWMSQLIVCVSVSIVSGDGFGEFGANRFKLAVRGVA